MGANHENLSNYILMFIRPDIHMHAEQNILVLLRYDSSAACITPPWNSLTTVKAIRTLASAEFSNNLALLNPPHLGQFSTQFILYVCVVVFTKLFPLPQRQQKMWNIWYAGTYIGLCTNIVYMLVRMLREHVNV